MREIFPEKKSQPVVGEHPREDGILCEVIIGSSGKFVQLHQELEVGDSSRPPLLHHARALQPPVPRERNRDKFHTTQLQILARAAQNPIGFVAGRAVEESDECTATCIEEELQRNLVARVRE